MNKSRRTFRGVSSVVSVMLVTAFIVASVVAVLYWALPNIQKSESIAELEKMKTTMSTLDDYIRLVSHSGNGTTRSLSVSMRNGKMVMTNSSITYDVVIGQELIKDGVAMQEKGIWMIGNGNGITLKLNYTSVEIYANSIVNGESKLVITKIGEKNGKPLVEVKES